MEKQLKIRVKIDSEFEIEANPNLNDWNNADKASKKKYIKYQVKNFLLDNIDDMIEDLLDNGKIEF